MGDRGESSTSNASGCVVRSDWGMMVYGIVGVRGARRASRDTDLR